MILTQAYVALLIEILGLEVSILDRASGSLSPGLCPNCLSLRDQLGLPGVHRGGGKSIQMREACF